MKNQLPKRKISAKATSFFATLMIVLLPAFANAASVSFGVTFGQPQSNGGACVGKGVCRESFDMSLPSAVGAVAVSFIVNETNPNIIMMRFSLSELTAKQPEKLAGFTDPTGYSFDSPYPMAGRPVFQPLNLMPGAMVPAMVKFPVTINEDIVTVYINYAHM